MQLAQPNAASRQDLVTTYCFFQAMKGPSTCLSPCAFLHICHYSGKLSRYTLSTRCKITLSTTWCPVWNRFSGHRKQHRTITSNLSKKSINNSFGWSASICYLANRPCIRQILFACWSPRSLFVHAKFLMLHRQYPLIQFVYAGKTNCRSPMPDAFLKTA